MSDVDWTTTEGCQLCNEHGPFEPWSRGEDARALHQAWHAIVAAMLDALRIPRFVDWLSGRLAR